MSEETLPLVEGVRWSQDCVDGTDIQTLGVAETIFLSIK